MCTTTSTTTTSTANDNNNNDNNNVSSTSTIEKKNVVVGERYIIIRNFINNEQDQTNIVKEILDCHIKNNNGINNLTDDNLLLQSSTSSIKLNLGIKCGDDLSTIVPLAISIIRKVFQEILHMKETELKELNDLVLINNDDITILQKMSSTTNNCSLCGLSLLYPINAIMKSHYDSPTQGGQQQKSEWLGLLSFGNTIVYNCNNNTIPLHSGDVLVMDSMSVLHGIDKVLSSSVDYKNDEINNNNNTDSDTNTNVNTNSSTKTDTCSNIPMYKKLNLPFPSRLGILFWQGKSNNNTNTTSCQKQYQNDNDDDELVIGVSNLFHD